MHQRADGQAKPEFLGELQPRTTETCNLPAIRVRRGEGQGVIKSAGEIKPGAEAISAPGFLQTEG